MICLFNPRPQEPDTARNCMALSFQHPAEQWSKFTNPLNHWPPWGSNRWDRCSILSPWAHRFCTAAPGCWIIYFHGLFIRAPQIDIVLLLCQCSWFEHTSEHCDSCKKTRNLDTWHRPAHNWHRHCSKHFVVKKWALKSSQTALINLVNWHCSHQKGVTSLTVSHCSVQLAFSMAAAGANTLEQLAFGSLTMEAESQALVQLAKLGCELSLVIFFHSCFTQVLNLVQQLSKVWICKNVAIQ